MLDIPAQDVGDLELLDKEFHNDSVNDKTGVLDVKLRLKDGTVIDIEIQNRWNDEFAQRTVFYWAKMYTGNLQKGEVYTKLPKCITINIVGEGFKLNERLVNWLRFIETDEREVRAMLADNSPVMEQANETVDVMLQDPKERWLYENRMKYEHDKASWEHFGYTKGMEAGLTKGAHQKSLETAATMKTLNYPLDDIHKITGLSEAEIAQL